MENTYLLTSIPEIIYNTQKNTAFRLGIIPFEDYFYSMTMLILNMMLFEYFPKQVKPIHE